MLTPFLLDPWPLNPASEITGNTVLLSPNIVPTVSWGLVDWWKYQYHGWVVAAKVLGHNRGSTSGRSKGYVSSWTLDSLYALVDRVW